MGWHDRAIDRHHRLIPITGSRLDNTFTKIRFGPTPEPLEDTVPPTPMRREVTPGMCPCGTAREPPPDKDDCPPPCTPDPSPGPDTAAPPAPTSHPSKLCDQHSSCHRPGRLVPPPSPCNPDTKTRPTLKTQGNCQRALVEEPDCTYFPIQIAIHNARMIAGLYPADEYEFQ